jgi:hypothetical protein
MSPSSRVAAARTTTASWLPSSSVSRRLNTAVTASSAPACTQVADRAAEAADPGLAVLAAPELLDAGQGVQGRGQDGGRLDGPGDLYDEGTDECARVPGEPFRAEAGLVPQRDRRLGGGRLSPVALEPVNRELDDAGPGVRLAWPEIGVQGRRHRSEELFPRFRGDTAGRFEERGGGGVVLVQQGEPERAADHVADRSADVMVGQLE